MQAGMSDPISRAIFFLICSRDLVFLILNILGKSVNIADASADPPPIPEATGKFLFKIILRLFLILKYL